MAPEMDTSGVFMEDRELWVEASKALYLENVSISCTYPKRIKLEDFPDTAGLPCDDLLIAFVSKVKTFLGAKTSV